MSSDARVRLWRPGAPGRDGATSLYLVRHGESTANVAATAAEAALAEVVDVPLRDADVPLTAIGLQQAGALRQWFVAQAPEDYPDSVWVSPYLRAVTTARVALAGRPDQIEIRRDERLRDRELGIVDLLTTRGVDARLPVEAARRRRLGGYYYRPPGGESWADVALRIRSFLGGLDSEQCGSNALVVTHDAVIVLIRTLCEGLTEHQALQLARTEPLRNASVTRLVRDNRSAPWRLHTYNDVSHLVAAGAPITTHTSAKDAHPSAS